MTITTVTRADLADAVIRKTSISRSLSAALIDLVFEEISAALGGGEAVTISSFATFQVHDCWFPLRTDPGLECKFQINGMPRHRINVPDGRRGSYSFGTSSSGFDERTQSLAERQKPF